MSLVTTANYKYYLGIGQSETTKDTELALLISSVEKRVKEFLNRDLEWAVYTDEIYDGSNKNCLILRQFPIIHVSAVKVYEGIDSVNAETWTTLVEHTDYDRMIIPVEAHLFYLDGYRFVKQFQNYKITYYAGYTAGSTLVSGSSVVGKKYQIAARQSVDFTLVGSSSNAVGTQFVATGTSSMSATDSLTELISMPTDIQMACMELLKITYANSPIGGDNRLGFLNVSSNAGGGSQNLSIDPEIEEKILKKIERYKANNV
jgi:hypothetical protein